MTVTTPAGYKRVRTLTETEYARERLPAGMIATVDSATAQRWIKAKLAIETTDADPPAPPPPGHRRLRMLHPTQYAGELLAAGRVVVIDEDTAGRWVTAALAVETREPLPIWTSCPQCGSAMTYPETPAADERWTQCKNPACNFGWLR